MTDKRNVSDLKTLKELAEKSTQVVGWYPHSQYDGYHPGRASVRGPFGRWLLVEGGDNGMGDPVKFPTPVADLYDDAKYAAAAMNSVPALLDEIDRLKKLCRYQYLTLGMYGTPYNYKTSIPYPDGSNVLNILRDGGHDARKATGIAHALGFTGDEIREWPGPGVDPLPYDIDKV